METNDLSKFKGKVISDISLIKIPLNELYKRDSSNGANNGSVTITFTDNTEIKILPIDRTGDSRNLQILESTSAKEPIVESTIDYIYFHDTVREFFRSKSNKHEVSSEAGIFEVTYPYVHSNEDGKGVICNNIVDVINNLFSDYKEIPNPNLDEDNLTPLDNSIIKRSVYSYALNNSDFLKSDLDKSLAIIKQEHKRSSQLALDALVGFGMIQGTKYDKTIKYFKL